MSPGDEAIAEKKIDGRTHFEGRLLRLEVDRVTLPGGHEAVREVVRHPGAAVVVPLHADGRVILVRQYRYAVARALLELPAGKLSSRLEPALDCARRELAEETGWAARTWRLLAAFYSAPGFSDELIHCFLALDLEPAPGFSPDNDERIEVVTVPFAEALDAVERGDIHDAKSIAGILLAARATSTNAVS